MPRIALADLLSPCSIVTSAYSTAAEQLAVGWARTGLVVVSLPPTGSLEAGLEALLGRNTRVLPGCESREWRVGSAPEVAAIEEVGAGVCGLVWLVWGGLLWEGWEQGR